MGVDCMVQNREGACGAVTVPSHVVYIRPCSRRLRKLVNLAYAQVRDDAAWKVPNTGATDVLGNNCVQLHCL